MGKKTRAILTIVAIIISIYIIFTMMPFGVEKYKSLNTGVVINVPKFSNFKEECCMYSASFKSIRSMYSLKREIKKELENYQKISCNNKDYYYNSEEDFTIMEYHVKMGFIFNHFNIVYTKGNACADDSIHQFSGKIIEVYSDGNFVVEPNENEAIRKSSDKIVVKNRLDKVLEVGTFVLVKYTGEVMESYPAQINTIDVIIIN